MFDLGWTELLLVAVVAIVVVGPKDLPKMLRTFGRTIGQLKRMASDFQGQFSDALREAEKQADIGDVKNTLSDVSTFDPLSDVKSEIAETENSINDGLKADASNNEVADEDWTASLEAPDLEEGTSAAESPEGTGDTVSETAVKADEKIASEAKS